MQHFGVCKKRAIGRGLSLPVLLHDKYRQAVKIMKITAVLLLVGTLHVSAGGFSQSITLSEKEAPLTKVFKAIEKQTDYIFFYNVAWVKKTDKVDVEVKDMQLQQVLELLFKNQPITYSITGRMITVFPKNEKPVINESVPPPPIDISGKVVDENGKPVPRVTVTIKGTNKQTLTNENGEFTLSGVEENAVLSFSSVNMEPFAIKVGGQREIFAKLKTKTSELDEVQIIAYGQTTKRFQTGNVTTVKGEDIQKQPVSNPLLALEGREAGLFITQSNGLPGSGVTVRIQGQNSISKGNDPFFVIDGVPYIFQLQNSGIDGILGESGSRIGGTGRGNPLNYINPSDIESIEVLKDADATAIYGSRAANGAILITTKKGKVGKTRVDINLQQGCGKVTRHMEMMNTQQYLEMRHEALTNDGITPSSTDYDLNGLWDTTRNTDWQKELIGGIARYTNINASVSGGKELMQYLIGSTYHRETTVFPGRFDNEKGSLHFSMDNTSSNRKFTIRLTGNYMIDNNYLPHQDLTQSAILMEPVVPSLYNSDGTLNWAPDGSGNSSLFNPLVYLYETYKNKTKNLLSNLTLKYEVLPGLDILTNFGYTDMQINDFTSTPLIAIDPVYRPYVPRTANYVSRNFTSWIVEPQITYTRTIGKSKIDFLLGTTIQQNKTDYTAISGEGYNSDAVLEAISAATTTHASNSKTMYKYNALFGRINYNWKNKYVLNLAARKDGSSRFGPKSRFHNFGSVGIAWIFSEENFLKNVKFLSFGKLKGSFGTTGNDQIGEYAYMNLYTAYYQGVPYQGISALATFTASNPYLEWEETQKLQAGMDLGFFSDRLLLSFTYAHNRSSNQLVPYRLPNLTGFNSIIQNFPATVLNTSSEISIQTKNIKSESFNWTSSVNLTIPHNKLVAFPGLENSAYATTLVIGQPISIMKGKGCLVSISMKSR